MEPLNSGLLAHSLNFHGQQMQKIWEAEYGEGDLVRKNVRDLNYQVYSERQKNLSFQDRGKRLKLQQFIVKKAHVLFTTDPADYNFGQEEGPVSEDMYAIMPPFETFLNVDKQNRLKYFFKNVKVGDLIIGTIVSKTQSGMMLKVLCTAGTGASIIYAADINVKAFCPVANVIPAVDKKGITRSYMMNDSVCCEVIEKIPDSDKMVCCMKGTPRKPNEPERRPALGLISAEDFPLVYKKSLEHKNESYDSVLEKSIGFNNPNNISHLAEVLGIKDHCTLMKGLKGRFAENEYANELRQVQASKWAYRNVADGIDHFKAGKHVEAFQCLNKALNIDPKNVEGLVARGALYANSGNFQKAISDFESALKLNPNHGNARKYMGETLVALGRSYEEEDKIEEARKSYQSCLSLIPNHEEAQNSLKFLKNKAAATKTTLIEPTELLLPNLAGPSSKTTADMNDALKQLLKNEEEEKKDKKKKKKSKKRKNKRHSSSSSSSSSSGSNDSSSSTSSSSSDSSSSSGDSDFKKRKKHRSRSHRREKQSSLSPLSKRMAMMDQSHDTPTNYNFNKPASTSNALFDFNLEQPAEAHKPTELTYEQRLRLFLQETKGDSDYEEKVRKFLEESSKWKKDKKGDDKKKKKKKDKKAKKESRKKKKEKKLKRKQFDLSEFEDHKKLRDAIKKELSKSKRSKKHSIPSDDDEYFLQKSGYSKRFFDSLPDLEELESKLNAYYALEKETKRGDLSESPKRAMDSPSPTREQKARQAVAEASAVSGAGKWKMQIGAGPSQASASNSRFKKKSDRDDWKDDLQEKRLLSSKNGAGGFDQSPVKKIGPPGVGPSLLPPDKNMSVRKVMAMKEPPPKRPDSPPKKILGQKNFPPLPPANKPLVNPGQVVLDKFGNFRLVTPPEMKKGRSDEMPPLPPGAPPKGPPSGRRPPEPPGRPRSDSRSPKRRSRSRSRGKYSRSRSSSGSHSRSRSYRSRSRSYYSRSRSRSGTYYSRSRSRSRSYSGDRRRFRRGGFRGRYNDRGTYYKPRFQNPRNNPRGRGGGGGGYYNRDSRYNDRDYRGGRGRPYYNNRGGRRPRGRYQRGGYRDNNYRDRRDYRSRSRDHSRSFSGSRDSEEQVKTTKPQQENKDKINKYVDNENEAVRHEGPLSEGEDRDDYNTNNEKFVDREAFDGKWAEKEGGGSKEGGGEKSEGAGDKGESNIPSESNIEEMDKFLNKVKKDKKEEMLERNKDLLKNKP